MQCLTIVSPADGVRVDCHWAAGASLLLEPGHQTAPSNCHALGMVEALMHVMSSRVQSFLTCYAVSSRQVDKLSIVLC